MLYDLSTLSNAGLTIIAHFMYRDHEGDRNLLIAASEELVRRGLLSDAMNVSCDIMLDEESKRRLIDYYCEFNLQHELFVDILEVGDPHLAEASEEGYQEGKAESTSDQSAEDLEHMATKRGTMTRKRKAVFDLKSLPTSALLGVERYIPAAHAELFERIGDELTSRGYVRTDDASPEQLQLFVEFAMQATYKTGYKLGREDAAKLLSTIHNQNQTPSDETLVENAARELHKEGQR